MIRILPKWDHQWVAVSTQNAEDVEVIKALSVRRWSQSEKVWWVPDTEMVRKFLVAMGGQDGPTRVLQPPKPSPIVYRRPPKKHQREANDMMHEVAGFGLFCEPGTGKTKMLIDDAGGQFTTGRAEALIVACPNSIKGNWADELKADASYEIDVHIHRADKAQRTNVWITKPDVPGVHKVLIVAIESLSHKSTARYVESFAKRYRCVFDVDESHRIKTPSASCTKNMLRISAFCPIKRVATGTPITRELEAGWAQFEFIDPEIFKMEFYSFRGYFSCMGGYKKKSAVANNNEQVFFELAKGNVFVAKKAECLDLPEKIFEVRKIEATPEIEKAYSDIAANVNADPSFAVAMVRDLRLHQVSGGFTYRIDDEQGFKELLAEIEAMINGGEASPEAVEKKIRKRYVSEPIPGENPKLTELMHVVEDTPGKVVVFCDYRAECSLVSNALRAYYGSDDAVVEFHGGVTGDDRDVARRRFQEDESCKAIVLQIRTGGVGITLHAASSMVFWSNDWSAIARIQAEDRIHRIGQRSVCNYVDLVMVFPWGEGMDSRVLRSVQQGKDYQQFVLDEIRAKNFLGEGMAEDVCFIPESEDSE